MKSNQISPCRSNTNIRKITESTDFTNRVNSLTYHFTASQFDLSESMRCSTRGCFQGEVFIFTFQDLSGQEFLQRILQLNVKLSTAYASTLDQQHYN